jgi:hypothetical protein
MSLPFLQENNWSSTVLAVDPSKVEGLSDPLLEQSVPSNTRVERANAISPRWTKRLGIGSLELRALPFLWRAGNRLLTEEKFDLVFFSTTMFLVTALGPIWKRRFQVPYIVDFQDPWLSDYYERNPGRRPPGGKLKYGFWQWIAKRLEPKVVRGATHIISVSSAYVDTFRRRYSDVPVNNFTTLPFGAPESDFSSLEALRVHQSIFDRRDGREHWVYVGRGGGDMAFAVRAFFTALKRYTIERPGVSERFRVHFLGTDYAPKERAKKTIQPIACELGLGEIVSEQTDRLPYFVTLRCLRDADALFVPGSDDPGYTASKIYPYILAKKPLLAVFHRESGVVDLFHKTNAGVVVTFGAGRNLKEVADDIYQRWFARWPLSAPATDWNAFAPHTAKAMTRKLCDIFDRVAAMRNGSILSSSCCP